MTATEAAMAAAGGEGGETPLPRKRPRRPRAFSSAPDGTGWDRLGPGRRPGTVATPVGEPVGRTGQPSRAPACMDGLRQDLTDLQGAVLDVFSRAGVVRRPSWKFPDRLSCDLDLVALLDRYDHVDGDPEFSQLAHVVLLELVIDRLLLLLQSFSNYTDGLTGRRRTGPPGRPEGPRTSLGLAALRAWNGLLSLGALGQRTVTQSGSQEDLPSLEPPPGSPAAGTRPPKSPPPGAPEPGSAPGRTPPPPTRAAHSQTVETSLVPCSACARVQSSLLDAGHAIAGLCLSQNLPSSLDAFQRALDRAGGPRPLAAADLGYWASEQGKDLARLEKHLRALGELVGPLRARLAEAEGGKEALEARARELEAALRRGQEERERLRAEAERELEDKVGESQRAVATLQRDKERLQAEAAMLERRLSALTEEMEEHQALKQDLEATRRRLQREADAGGEARARVSRLEDQVQLLSGKLDGARQRLDRAGTELDKEKARVESVARHREALQAKHRNLTQQLSGVAQEREELRASLGAAEDARRRLEGQLPALEAERGQLQRRLAAQQELLRSLRRENQRLEGSAQDSRLTVSELEGLVRQLRERERLLVAFPALHVPPEARWESSGDVAEDMERQLRANNVRLHVLEEENRRLRASLAKVKEGAQQGTLRMIPPTRLWSQPPGTAPAPERAAGSPSASSGHAAASGGHAGQERSGPPGPPRGEGRWGRPADEDGTPPLPPSGPLIPPRPAGLVTLPAASPVSALARLRGAGPRRGRARSAPGQRRK
ncbi:coiled-coil domain-containing protein 157 [Ornithorhynchus anatinus]|nr:coiled-coil domain-containing protein 157 [Ornithorhynchus anatinus]